MKKSGFVSIIGRSNVGKSTLLNSLVGSKVSITTPKPQTTRRPIQGVITCDQGQAVLVDTPGFMQKARDPLTQKLTGWIKDALRDVELVIYVVDPTRQIGDEEKASQRMIEHVTVPKLLVINKMDDPTFRYNVDFYRDLAKKFDAYVEVSALTGKDVNLIKRWIFDNLPEGEAHYPDFQLTNQSNKEWLSELIREKLFLRLREELPYSTHVEVEDINERQNGVVYVKATVFTSAARYKPMIIGVGARGIKEIGQATRRELEAITNKKYYLDLNVEVDASWLNRLEI
jgi:GTP-binding protein Era